MPTYDYVCAKCGAEEEIACHVDRRDYPYECPECFGTMKRQISKPNVQFKGDGWTPRYHR